MKRIMIINSMARPQRIRGTSAWDDEPTEYIFDHIWNMEEAYRYMGAVLDDIVWVGLPENPRISQYMESRIRRFA